MLTLTRRSRLALVAGLVALTATMSGCSQVVDAFNSIQNAPEASTPTPEAGSDDGVYQEEGMPIESEFSYNGSVAMSYDVADDLELRLDVWAVDSKRTREWTPDAEKTFGFAVNVYDHRVDDKAVLTEKRRVYMSQISITSQTSQTSNQMNSPFQFSADPRTLVPTDTLRSDRGLLINSYQGGLLVPETTIRQLPADTYGVTLQFSLQVWVEGTADTESSFQQQTVYQVLPIAIYGESTGESTPEPTTAP